MSEPVDKFRYIPQAGIVAETICPRWGRRVLTLIVATKNGCVMSELSPTLPSAYPSSLLRQEESVYPIAARAAHCFIQLSIAVR